MPLRQPLHIEVNSWYLVYDPAASPHYQVFSVTRFLYKREPGNVFYDRPKYKLDPVVEQSEWPPSVYTPYMCSRRGPGGGRRGHLFEKVRLQALSLT